MVSAVRSVPGRWDLGVMPRSVPGRWDLGAMPGCGLAESQAEGPAEPWCTKGHACAAHVGGREMLQLACL